MKPKPEHFQRETHSLNENSANWVNYTGSVYGVWTIEDELSC